MSARRATMVPRRRRIIIASSAVLAVLIAGTGIVAWRLSASAVAPVTTRTVTVREQTIRETVATTGTVEPKTRADISFSSSGMVTSVKVGVGDKVSKGQALATIDDASLEADLQAAEANYGAANDDLATLEDSGSATDAQLKAASSNVAVQEGKLAQARAAVKAATMRFPIAGTVALVNIAKGDAVAAAGGRGSGGGSSGGGSSSGSQAALTVISTGQFTVSTSVGSADLARVKKGLQAEMTLTGSTTTIFGTVSSVAVMATSGSGSTSSGASAAFAVTIDVTGKPSGLYAGASTAGVHALHAMHRVNIPRCVGC